MSNVKNMKGVLKQQYFLSSYDVNNEQNTRTFKCNDQNDLLLWKKFTMQMRTKPTNIMLLLDQGASLSSKQFEIIKEFGK